MSNKVMRHSLMVRLNHWLVALSGIFLVFTGMGEMPMYKRYNLIKVPGFHWVADFELNLVLHYIGAAVFTFAVLFHIVYHLRRRELAAWPKKGDVRESLQIIKAMLTGKEEPAHEKFLAEQRVAYAVMGSMAILLIATGLIKSYKNLGAIVLEPAVLQTVTLIHTASTMLFLFLIIAHVGAFLIKANWPLLPSMITGRVSREYAEKRHGKWQI